MPNTEIPLQQPQDAGDGDSAEARDAALGPDARELLHRDETPLQRLGGALMRNDNLPLMAALVLVGVVFQIAAHGLFLNSRNVVDLVVQLAPLGFLALASSLMILMGEIDLSLGSVAGFTAAIGAYLMSHGVPTGWGIVLMLLAGAVIGLIQGAIVVLGQVRSFVVTLAGYLAWYGAQLYALGKNASLPVSSSVIINLSSSSVPSVVLYIVVGLVAILMVGSAVRIALRDTSEVPIVRWSPVGWRVLLTAVAVWVVSFFHRGGGLPYVVLLLIVIVGLAAFLLENTASGRYVYAIGGNLQAARDNGIRVPIIKTVVFIMAGTLAGLAGLALLSYTSGADSSTGGGTLLLEAIGAAVVGGISLTGGRGSVRAALGGALLLEGVTNGLNLLNTNSDLIYIIEGVVVVVALLFDSTVRRRLQNVV